MSQYEFHVAWDGPQSVLQPSRQTTGRVVAVFFQKAPPTVAKCYIYYIIRKIYLGCNDIWKRFEAGCGFITLTKEQLTENNTGRSTSPKANTFPCAF